VVVPDGSDGGNHDDDAIYLVALELVRVTACHVMLIYACNLTCFLIVDVLGSVMGQHVT